MTKRPPYWLGRSSLKRLLRASAFTKSATPVAGLMSWYPDVCGLPPLTKIIRKFSWTFIIFFAVAIVAYVTTNHVLGKSSWDPYPFILLNLFLSMLAAIQAPVIMMSQNRQDTKDRLRSELDFDVNRRAASDIQGLSRKLNLLGEKIGDIEDLLRGRFQHS